MRWACLKFHQERLHVGPYPEGRERSNGATRALITVTADQMLCLDNKGHPAVPPWANTSNTPFRKHKTTDHEGGICTPLIAHWPAGIANPSSICRQPGHIVDVMATCVEVADAPYPSAVTPLEGKSLAPTLQGETPLAHSVLFWQYLGDLRAIRQGRWKALKLKNSETWMLFDFETDRSEVTDVSAQYPDKLAELQALWDAWKANSYTTDGLTLPDDETRRRGDAGLRLDDSRGAILQDGRSVYLECRGQGRHSVELLTLGGRRIMQRTEIGRAHV